MRAPSGRGWRDYQRRLRAEALRRRLAARLPVLFLAAAGLLALGVGIWQGIEWFGSRRGSVPVELASHPPKAAEKPARFELAPVLKDLVPDPEALKDPLAVQRGNQQLLLVSSLDAGLQDYLRGLLARSGTVRAAAVVLRPADGAILAMAEHGRTSDTGHLCLEAGFPAASLFKIITAAAALEHAGYTPDRPVLYHGRMYTLYKGQLRRKETKNAARTSFRKAFADSINPVFGKLGIHELGSEVLTEYAERFYFNREIPFDFPLEKSRVQVPEEAFGIAEIASGFNKRTLISPLHAAMLVSAAINDGLLLSPWLVERVQNGAGEVLYERQRRVLNAAISGETASDLRQLMQETIRNGTGRKPFASMRRKKAFREVEIGGKTGTVNDPTDQYKIDWFVAYALPKEKEKAIAIAVLGIHGSKLGLRANELGSQIINRRLAS